jgi:hypothetical protein
VAGANACGFSELFRFKVNLHVRLISN